MTTFSVESVASSHVNVGATVSFLEQSSVRLYPPSRLTGPAFSKTPTAEAIRRTDKRTKSNENILHSNQQHGVLAHKMRK